MGFRTYSLVFVLWLYLGRSRLLVRPNPAKAAYLQKPNSNLESARRRLAPICSVLETPKRLKQRMLHGCPCCWVLWGFMWDVLILIFAEFSWGPYVLGVRGSSGGALQLN